MEAAYLIMSCIGGFVLLIFLGMEKGRGVNEGWVSSDLFSYLGLEQWFGEGRGTAHGVTETPPAVVWMTLVRLQVGREFCRRYPPTVS